MSKILERIKYLRSEIAVGARHDGWTLAGLKAELKKLLERVKQNKES
jgi:hypothetical protein|tara:strand:+ start:1024 stop:1164 length:141 start_codon:yes stop_codon:yes gene_type:complete